MHKNGMFYALVWIDNHIISYIIRMLSTENKGGYGMLGTSTSTLLQGDGKMNVFKRWIMIKWILVSFKR